MQLEPREPGGPLEPRWLDVDAASRYLCMSVHALYHKIGRRQIPFVKQGRSIRFDRFALDRWMAKGVRNGFDETRRPLVFQENDQRAAVRRVDGVRGSKIGGTSRLGHRARHPRRHPRLEEHDSELRGMVGDLQEDLHTAEVVSEPRRGHRRALPAALRRETARRVQKSHLRSAALLFSQGRSGSGPSLVARRTAQSQ